MTEKADKARTFIAETLEVDIEKVVDGAQLVMDLNADSLDCIELVMALEEEFDLIIDDDDVESFQTVKDVIDRIERE